ncbi:cupin domain-containing protein [Alphaproteobacteria bacterium]|nr:cupin domain-containing protein [Alphaproteobacteria bacterium]
MNDPDKLIKKLNMTNHREGGFFSETFRDINNNVSLIYYLLKKNQRSHWHRLTKNEILHFYEGSPLNVHISKDSKTSYTKILGNDLDNNESHHLVLAAGSWFSMTSSGSFSLIGCTVSPGFDYKDFELAPKNWEPGK